MKTMCLNETGSALVEREADIPKAGAGELLIRVHAAGVTPTEMQWYPTTHTQSGEARRNAVPGHEFSGVVAGVGAHTFGFAEGAEVYGCNDWFADGATAEYCVAQPTSVAPKPRHLSHAEAAAVPIGALTAWQGLFEKAKLQSGERVLIHGGSGGVGVFAVQLARRAGAYVVTTASERNRRFLAELGADVILDYQTERFEEKAHDIDVVFDTVGGETLQRSWGVLSPSGRLVTVAANSEGHRDERTKAAFFIVEAKQSQLREIATGLDIGELRSFVDATVPLEEASTAYFGAVPKRKGYGKVVVTVAA
jgi:NADPH:quinone reductase-like Zn-dependent oxidoreductase